MRDSARTAYQRVLDRAESAGYVDLFHAGVSIFQCSPPPPDSASITERCRSQVRGTAAVVRRACRDSVSKAVRVHREASGENFQLAARAFEAVLEKNPYYRDALFNLANTYYQMRDTSKFLSVAQRLVAVDPMNRTSNLLLAQAFQMRAQGDSALRYLQISDSILPVEVNVTELSLSDSAAHTGGVITNFHKRPSKPLTIAFEFVNLKGEVVATSDYNVPAVDPEGNHLFRVSVQGPGITAYRYREKR
jgi:tetratricopeptide (TPR) repeat protein